MKYDCRLSYGKRRRMKTKKNLDYKPDQMSCLKQEWLLEHTPAEHYL